MTMITQRQHILLKKIADSMLRHGRVVLYNIDTGACVCYAQSELRAEAGMEGTIRIINPPCVDTYGDFWEVLL